MHCFVRQNQVEDNRFSVSIHYRNCARVDVPRVREVVERVQARHERIRMGSGKEVCGYSSQYECPVLVGGREHDGAIIS